MRDLRLAAVSRGAGPVVVEGVIGEQGVEITDILCCMDAEQISAKTKNLRSTIPSGSGTALPWHVALRMQLLVGEDVVVYADGAWESTTPNRWTGQALVLTDKRVVFASFADAATRFPEGLSQAPEFTTSVSTWRRADLASVDLISDRPDAPGGSDRAWLNMVTTHELPPGVAIVAMYANGAKLVSRVVSLLPVA